MAAGVPVTQRAPQGFEPARRNFKPALKREIPNPSIMSGASVIYAQQDGRTCYVTVSPAIRSDMNDLKPLIAQALAGRERSILAEHAFDFNASTLNLRFRLR